MECSRCRQSYDEELRRPKLLPCGHVFCQPCLQSADRCFGDDKEISQETGELPDDLFTLGLLRLRPTESEDVPGSVGGVSLWCQTCATVAAEACLDSQDEAEAHELHSMRRHRHEVLLRQLESILAVLEGPAAELPNLDDEQMLELAASGQVEVRYGEGDDDGPAATVQLGGSCAEDSDVAWAVQQLLLRHIGMGKPTPEPNPKPAAAETKDKSLGLFGLFGDECMFDDDEGDENDESMLGLMALDAEDPTPDTQDVTPTAYAELSPEKRKQVRKLVNVSGKRKDVDPLQMLKDVAPHLEELQLVKPDREHLLATLRMPKLWRLEVFGYDNCADPFVVPAELPHDGGLRVLQACLSPPTVASLMRAHHRTLEHVLIMPPLRSRFHQGWPGAQFDQLDYRGGGRLNLPFLRSPYFPVREPGDFPALKSIEFESAAVQAAGTSPKLEPIRSMFPGVYVGEPKTIVGWKATVRLLLNKGGKYKT